MKMEYFDDCPVCQAMKKGEAEGRAVIKSVKQSGRDHPLLFVLIHRAPDFFEGVKQGQRRPA